MKILGLHDGHNSTACLLEDGKILQVLQEERIKRVKNYSGFPRMAIEEIFSTFNINSDDIDYVALNGKHLPFITDRKETLKYYRKSSTLTGNCIKIIKNSPMYYLYKQKRNRERLKDLHEIGIPKDKVEFIDHHLAHASAAYYGSPWWQNEDVLIITNDGAGDNICATVNIGRNGNIERIFSLREEESVAWYYAMVTFALGMVPLEHEYKVMGLAPYSPEEGREIAFNKFNNLMKFNGVDTLGWERNSGVPPAAYSYGFVKDLIELMRFDWIAAGLQRWVESYIAEWIQRCIKKTGINKLAFSGGFFMNVKANEVISKMPEIHDMFVFPSCGDESNSIGAAYTLYAEKCRDVGKEIDINPFGPIYFGTDIKDSEVEKSTLKFENIYIERYSDINKKIGELLSEGKIVARCNGKMEFGARALGNRSILTNPSNQKAVRIINDMIKNRDF